MAGPTPVELEALIALHLGARRKTFATLFFLPVLVAAAACGASLGGFVSGIGASVMLVIGAAFGVLALVVLLLLLFLPWIDQVTRALRAPNTIRSWYSLRVDTRVAGANVSTDRGVLLSMNDGRELGLWPGRMPSRDALAILDRTLRPR